MSMWRVREEEEEEEDGDDHEMYVGWEMKRERERERGGGRRRRWRSACSDAGLRTNTPQVQSSPRGDAMRGGVCSMRAHGPP